MVDESLRVLPLSGLALAIFVVSIVCLVLSTICVGLRVHVRVSEKTFGWDDALILAGLVVYTVDVALACHGATVGLGTRNAELNTWLMIEGAKYLMLWMLIYVTGLALIKSSVCVTLLRVAAANATYKIATLSLLGLILATFVATFIGILLLCKPVSANWTGQGECAGMGTMVGLSYMSTASTILTDLSLAVLPGVMVWGTPMNINQKVLIVVLLSFGSIASVTTMVRTPFISHYWTPSDNLDYWTGYIVFLSNIESAVGLIASSVPPIRKLFKRKSTEPSDGVVDHKSLVTFGSTPVRAAQRFRNPTDQGMSFASVHAGDWTRLQDRDSDTSREEINGIRAEYSYDVEMSRLSSVMEAK
ncbi:hypothetical protein VM1G_05785 [Cytospora mali]|uniref:Rhodopsin domain-containing protein n=1 Tax=Cytospora mali TaxID=578113 RepID=A0A194W3Q1_CYTMA|nr:hypothetical protein VM1G_05785 [Valsa mali]